MPTREDFQLLLQLDQACKFGKDAKKFVWSDAASGENGGHAFFEKYGWDSDERMYVNEVATYPDMSSLAGHAGGRSMARLAPRVTKKPTAVAHVPLAEPVR